MFKKLFSKIPPRYLIVAVLILALGILVIRNNKPSGTSQTPQIEVTSTTPEEVILSEKETIIEEVGKLTTLPEGEIPTIATITDADNLRTQPLFKDAQNGYKVLIYTQAKKAIVYDPVNKKIINIAPINIATSSAAQTPEIIKIIIRNGTSVAQLGNNIESDILVSLPNAKVIAKENALRTNYEDSMVVVLNQSFITQAEKIARDFGMKIGQLPKGESVPAGGDILIFLGADIL